MLVSYIHIAISIKSSSCGRNKAGLCGRATITKISSASSCKGADCSCCVYFSDIVIIIINYI